MLRMDSHLVKFIRRQKRKVSLEHTCSSVLDVSMKDYIVIESTSNIGSVTSLRKLAHAIYRDFFFFSDLKIENFIGKILVFFLFLLQNIDGGV